MKIFQSISISNIKGSLALITLGLSLGIAQLSQIIIGMTDTIMLGILGANKLAAGSLVNSIIIVFILFGTGTLQALNPMMGAAFGRQRKSEISQILKSGLLIAITSALPLIIIASMLKFILTIFRQDPIIIDLASQYSMYLIPGFFPAFSLIPIQIYLITISAQKQILQLSIIGIILNFLLNYLLMFDSFGIKSIGIRGCAISTSISNLLIFLLASALVLQKESTFLQKLRSVKLKFPIIRSILKLGIPIGFVILSETLILAVASIMMGSISKDALAAFSIVIQWLAIVYMIPIGFSNALTSKISFELGKQNLTNIYNLIYSSILIIVIYLFMISLGLILFRDVLIDLIYKNNQHNIHDMAISFMPYIAIIQFINGLIVVSAGILRGFRDTKSPLIIVLFVYWFIGCTLMFLLQLFFGYTGILLSIIFSYSLACFGVISEVKNKLTNLSHIITEISKVDSQILSDS